MTLTSNTCRSENSNGAAPRSNASWALRALNWLAERDRRYREAQKLRRMPGERLDDVGLTRHEAEIAFRHGGPVRKARVGLGAARTT